MRGAAARSHALRRDHAGEIAAGTSPSGLRCSPRRPAGDRRSPRGRAGNTRPGRQVSRRAPRRGQRRAAVRLERARRSPRSARRAGACGRGAAQRGPEASGRPSRSPGLARPARRARRADLAFPAGRRFSAKIDAMVDVAEIAERGGRVSSRDVGSWAPGGSATGSARSPDSCRTARRFTWLQPADVVAVPQRGPRPPVRRPVRGARRRWVARAARARRPTGTSASTGATSATPARSWSSATPARATPRSTRWCPGCSRSAQGTGFAVIASDVIYPAGSADDYDDKFFRPYQDYRAPIYAIPGNHDWYDGLGGFMRVFCGTPRAARRARRRAARPGARLLWRRPRADRRGARSPRRGPLRPAGAGRAAAGAVLGDRRRTGCSWSASTPGIARRHRRRTGRLAAPGLAGPAARRCWSPASRSTWTTSYHPCPIEGGGTVDDDRPRPGAPLRRGDRRRHPQLPALPGAGGDRRDPVHRLGRRRRVHARHPHHPAGGRRRRGRGRLPLLPAARRLACPSTACSTARRLRHARASSTSPPRRPSRSSPRGSARPDPRHRATAGARHPPRLRWAARAARRLPFPFRLPVRKIYHRYVSELADCDTPPFFKSFLRAGRDPGRAAHPLLRAPPAAAPRRSTRRVEDEVAVPLVPP